MPRETGESIFSRGICFHGTQFPRKTLFLPFSVTPSHSPGFLCLGCCLEDCFLSHLLNQLGSRRIKTQVFNSSLERQPPIDCNRKHPPLSWWPGSGQGSQLCLNSGITWGGLKHPNTQVACRLVQSGRGGAGHQRLIKLFWWFHV